MIEFTDAAISKAIEKTSTSSSDTIRIGITGGGCAGYEYVFRLDSPTPEDNIIDYGKFKVAIDPMSVEYIQGTTVDWVQEGLNEFFKLLNPNETSSCGCGVSVQF